MASDVYAWGCVCFEIFTGELPYAHIPNGHAVVLEITSGRCPKRPEASSLPWTTWGLNEEIWSFMERCWSRLPDKRPSSAEIVAFLKPQLSEDVRQSPETGILSAAEFRHRIIDPINIANVEALDVELDRILGSMIGPEAVAEVQNQVHAICARFSDIISRTETYEKFLNCRDDQVQDLVDVLYMLMDHASVTSELRADMYLALVRLCRQSGVCPRSFSIEGVTDREESPYSSWSFGDIFKADYYGEPVCLKVVKRYRDTDVSQSKLRKALSREAVGWARLSHPNILPFYGIYRLNDSFKSLCIVSPWTVNGNVHEYLKEKRHADRPRLIYGIASGLDYLHKNGVIHGDLKCLNVLVSDSEQALVTDFGFSSIRDDNDLGGLVLSVQASGGMSSFEAPELVENPDMKVTEATDVFAFGMMFATPPFTKQDSAVRFYLRILQNIPPPKWPGDRYSRRGLTNDIWGTLRRCMNHDPLDRPTATEIVHHLPPPDLEEDLQDSQWTPRIQRPVFESKSSQAAFTNVLSLLNTI
ncbi:hypothetical protein H0H92_005433 [Tricholoma furcatifolium]|nr:hypothetical protein H0H92_005433 [Tricholoma furcatifolium]